jgi:hypothetical protein
LSFLNETARDEKVPAHLRRVALNALSRRH